MSEAGGDSLRFLKAYAFVSTSVVVVLAIVAFREMQHAHFKEIDVQRINIVEPAGTLRMTISNHARMPDPVIGGKSYPLRSGTGGAGAGLIFFNDEGNENGGLTYTGRKTATGHSAGAGLSFDQYNQDETVTLSYDDEDGERRAEWKYCAANDADDRQPVRDAQERHRIRLGTCLEGRKERRLQAASRLATA